MHLSEKVETLLACHVAKDPRDLKSNHVVAPSLSENENNLNLIASTMTPLILKVLQICENLDKCACRSLANYSPC